MAHYPIDNKDDLLDAVNYVLSGPTSLGQNFEGMSAVGDPNLPYIGTPTGTYFTGTTIPLFTRDSTTIRWPSWSSTTVPVTITNIVPQTVDGDRLDIDFTLPANYNGTDNSTTPFVEGQLITVSGVTPAGFDGQYQIINVAFSTTSMTVVAATPQTWPAYTSGGDITWNYDTARPTDCSAIVTVTGPTDRVFVSSQATTRFGWYDDFGYSGALNITINSQVNRYRSVATTTLPDYTLDSQGRRVYSGYIWEFDSTLIDVPSYIPYTLATGAYEHDMGTNIFNNIIDSPGIGHYWYVLEFYFDNPYGPGTAYPLYMITTNFRSFTAQVIKR
jgi:hypothetical protein